MFRTLQLQLLLCSMLTLAITSGAMADVKLPSILDSQMVIQRDVPIHVWGSADSGEEITVNFGDNSASTTANKNGKWTVELPAMKADGKSHTMTITANNKIKLDDILIGDVWIGSGQSNMEMRLKSTAGAKQAITDATHPNIRLFHVPKVKLPQPATDVNAKWKSCTPENIPDFSAVLYYFGRKLNHDVDVPIGLINSSWGGSPIEPWTIKDGKSGAMYNGMIAPLQPFAVRGVIWYQGESNTLKNNGLAYAGKMKDLITGWRDAWKNELPFYFVQIAPWSGRYQPGQLPALWEAQTATLKLPATGMAVTTDLVDNIADIHPKNKLDVGIRLALWALAKSYRRDDVIYSGPLYESMTIEGDSIRIQFAHAGNKLKSRDDKPLTEFKIAGKDGKFVDAVAKIDGNTILVHADDVAAPTQIQFGWHKVANPNLINEAGLPAAPFQTNHWTGGTRK